MIQARGKLPHVRVVQWLGMCWLDFGRCSHATWLNVSCFSFKFWVEEQKKLRREFYGFLIINHVSCDTAFLQRMRLMSRQMERMRRIVGARKYCEWIRRPFRKHCLQSEPGGERQRLENICQFTILQASVTTGNVIGCSIYQDELYHHRDSITLRKFPVIKVR